MNVMGVRARAVVGVVGAGGWSQVRKWCCGVWGGLAALGLPAG